MSLYAIGDLHLHFRAPLKSPGQRTDRVWKNHEERCRGVEYRLVSGDYLLWNPERIL